MSSKEKSNNESLLIAIPTANERLCMHFGHCEQFALLTVNTEKKKVLGTQHLDPPPHEPGLLPKWLDEQGVRLVIAGGMGRRAQDIFAENGIEVIVGAPVESPGSLAQSYLDGTLQPGENTCDH